MVCPCTTVKHCFHMLVHNLDDGPILIAAGLILSRVPPVTWQLVNRVDSPGVLLTAALLERVARSALRLNVLRRIRSSPHFRARPCACAWPAARVSISLHQPLPALSHLWAVLPVCTRLALGSVLLATRPAHGKTKQHPLRRLRLTSTPLAPGHTLVRTCSARSSARRVASCYVPRGRPSRLDRRGKNKKERNNFLFT